jgi:Icc-related predicted phosphoesterase
MGGATSSRILAFTDFHGNNEAYGRAKELITNKKPDCVIVAGDLVNRDSNRAKQFLFELASVGPPVYFVPGNMDSDELGDWTGGENVHALHARCEKVEAVSLIGLGGSPHGPFRTIFEYSEEEASRLVEAAIKSYRGGQLIFVSHCPPKNTKLDQATNGEHVGSTAVREFVERKQPILVVSGHVHEAQGTDALGPSIIVNTGPAQLGRYADITLGNNVTVKFGRFF